MPLVITAGLLQMAQEYKLGLNFTVAENMRDAAEKVVRLSN